MKAFTLPYPPSKNRLHRRVGRLTILSREARDYKTIVAARCLSQGMQPLDGQVSVTLSFYRPRKIGDVDGRIPWTLDCLQGLAFHNDSQVVELHCYRLDDKANPRVEVVIERSEL